MIMSYSGILPCFFVFAKPISVPIWCRLRPRCCLQFVEAALDKLQRVAQSEATLMDDIVSLGTGRYVTYIWVMELVN